MFIALGSFSIYNIFKWKDDNEDTDILIEDVQDLANITEVSDNDNTIIVNPVDDEEIQQDNPYYDYIKMNLIYVDLEDLKNTNNDVVGWIKVNGTNINYPFVKTNDNSYYLTHNFYKSYSTAGWVFMDYRNSFTDKNIILYAHGRVDGTMFGSLKNVLSSDWYSDTSNHVVNISAFDANSLWQVFSVYKIELTSDYLQVNFGTDNEYLEFLEMLRNRSEYDFSVSLNENDQILTLSTCYGTSDRLVLHAKLIKMEEK